MLAPQHHTVNHPQHRPSINNEPNQQLNGGFEIQVNNEFTKKPSDEPTDDKILMPYAFYESDGSNTLRSHYFSLSDALKALKKDRDGVGGFVVPANAAARDAFPYRNKMGPLCDDHRNHWGYHLRWPNRDVVVSLWIEKGPCYPEHAHFGITLKEELKANSVTRKEFQKLKIDYVARLGSRVPPGGRFDEDMEDFVFKGEEAYGRVSGDEVGEGAEGVPQAVAVDEDREMTQ